MQANRVPIARSWIRKNSDQMPVGDELSELLRVQRLIFIFPHLPQLRGADREIAVE